MAASRGEHAPPPGQQLPPNTGGGCAMRPTTFRTYTLQAIVPAIRVVVAAPYRQRIVARGSGARLSPAVEEINNPNAGSDAGYAFTLGVGSYAFILPAGEALFAGAAAPVDLSVAASEAVFDCCDMA